MAVVIAGERSGSGKTTITLALLSALRQQGQSVQSFKVGPDYIDPMFHRFATDRPCYNLDAVLTSEAYLRDCFARHTQNVSNAVVEGVMGLFDGAAEPAGYGSTAAIAKHLNLPVILVVDCRSMSQSIAALVHGYRTMDPQLHLAGVILNRVGSDRHLEILTTALAPLHLPILGIFRREDEISLPDRHLGLVPTDELPELRQVMHKLAALGQAGFNWEQLRPWLSTVGAATTNTAKQPIQPLPKTRIAVARDAAFNFYYADNLEQLEDLGAELVYWSPLNDQQVPTGIQGLYFGGGFPEMFAAPLSANQTIRQTIRTLIQSGLPTYAECGGLMYLAQAITDFSGNDYPMVDILPTKAIMGQRLTLGYRSAIAQANTPLVRPGQLLRGHEFHRSHLSIAPTQALFQLHRSTQIQGAPITDPPHWEGWHQPNLHASYLHLHWGATPELPQRWLQQCAAFTNPT
ncbi:cobyrinate a,c-diamide synthase [filamentous cyanobacterium LEGE 11480]|uniref:Cobyrinate a,c-diamide synthase n=1 Tax=Romeriopsis navalis LEGE 11480 TaxID=2777977 RepID=A0A928VQF7_9CYAN|nr:cobyrinate a,c-diamide synthase [Romeriopsis navalis]MBE9030219.1 cobyrinate a,c-diamide synthase [Romeriopsis navalis LEGE 11480]